MKKVQDINRTLRVHPEEEFIVKLVEQVQKETGATLVSMRVMEDGRLEVIYKRTIEL